MSAATEELDGSIGLPLTRDLPIPPRADADAVRASLLAVKAAQEAARVRARRETWRARFWFMVIVAGLGGGGLLLRARSARKAAAVAAVTAPAVPVAPTPVADNADLAGEAPQPMAVGAQPLDNPAAPSVATAATADVTAPTPTEAPTAPTAEPVAAAEEEAAPRATHRATASAASANAAPGSCEDLYRKQRWRLAASACTRAFEAKPNDAKLALRVAQAFHARNRIGTAGHWARQAIALDRRTAEAFIILAHADLSAGRPADAAQAYRRYLALAPNGWHAGEAREALREGHGGAGDSSGARETHPKAETTAAPAAESEGG